MPITVSHVLSATTPDQREKQREANRRSYRKHAEARRAYCRESQKLRRKTDPDRIRARRLAWHEKNRDRINELRRARRSRRKAAGVAEKKYQLNPEKKRAYYEANKSRWRAQYRSWYAKNRDAEIERANVRRARRLKAMPKWANRNSIRVIYAEARRLTEETGVQHHVDHVIPLQGDGVCGLHWEGNLQVLTAAANLAKSNQCPQVSITR